MTYAPACARYSRKWSGIDSLAVVKLISLLEEKLNIKIPPGNLQPDDFDSVDVIIQTLEREAH
jgi:acyl carrier protein